MSIDYDSIEGFEEDESFEWFRDELIVFKDDQNLQNQIDESFDKIKYKTTFIYRRRI